MASSNFFHLQTGADSWLKALFLLLALLATTGILVANTAWLIKLTGLLLLFLYFVFTWWQMLRQESTRQLRIFSNATVSLIDNVGEECPGILESNSWTTRWVSVVPVGRFDRWRTQRILVCASRNKASEYRQLIRVLRLGSGSRSRTGLLGPG